MIQAINFLGIRSAHNMYILSSIISSHISSWGHTITGQFFGLTPAPTLPIFKFTQPAALDNIEVLDDTIAGGNSFSSFSLVQAQGHTFARFRGALAPSGGSSGLPSWASVRTVATWHSPYIAAYAGIRLWVRGDGRAYKVSLAPVVTEEHRRDQQGADVTFEAYVRQRAELAPTSHPPVATLHALGRPCV